MEVVDRTLAPANVRLTENEYLSRSVGGVTMILTESARATRWFGR